MCEVSLAGIRHFLKIKISVGRTYARSRFGKLDFGVCDFLKDVSAVEVFTWNA